VIIKKIDDATALDGYDDLKPEDKKRVSSAVEAGHVAPEDIPESARKPEGDDEKPKPKRAPRKAKKDEGDDAADDEEKPKKTKARTTKVKISLNCLCWSFFSTGYLQKKADTEAESDDAAEEKPKKRAPAKKKAEPKEKAAPKKRGKKKVSFCVSLLSSLSVSQSIVFRLMNLAKAKTSVRNLTKCQLDLMKIWMLRNPNRKKRRLRRNAYPRRRRLCAVHIFLDTELTHTYLG